MFNDCTFIGNLGKDPESRTSQKGETFVTFSVAVNKQGANREDKPLWINVVAFKSTAEFVSTYVKGGYRVLIQGPIELQEYEAKDGTNRQSLKMIANRVVNLTAKEAGAPSTQAAAASASSTKAPATKAVDEDIPF